MQSCSVAGLRLIELIQVISGQYGIRNITEIGMHGTQTDLVCNAGKVRAGMNQEG